MKLISSGRHTEEQRTRTSNDDHCPLSPPPHQHLSANKAKSVPATHREEKLMKQKRQVATTALLADGGGGWLEPIAATAKSAVFLPSSFSMLSSSQVPGYRM